MMLAAVLMTSCSKSRGVISQGTVDVSLDLTLTGIITSNNTTAAKGETTASRGTVNTTADVTITNQADPGNPITENWIVTLDDETFDITSNFSRAMTPGTYDFALTFTVVDGGQTYYYEGNTTGVAVDDTTGGTINMTVKPTLGTQTVKYAVTEVPEITFNYANSAIITTGMSIDYVITGGLKAGTLDTENHTGTIALNPTAQNSLKLNMPIGAYTVVLKLMDGATQLGKSITSQEAVTLTAGMDIEMDIIPLSGDVSLNITTDGGDLVINADINQLIIDEVGGVTNLRTVITVDNGTTVLAGGSTLANNYTQDMTNTFTNSGVAGTPGTDSVEGTATVTLTGFRYDTVDITVEFYDNLNSGATGDDILVGTITYTAVVIDNGDVTLTGNTLELIVRNDITGDFKAKVSIYVHDAVYEALGAGYKVILNKNVTTGLNKEITLTATDTNGRTVGYIYAGTYTVTIENSTGTVGTLSNVNLVVTELGVVNKYFQYNN